MPIKFSFAFVHRDGRLLKTPVTSAAKDVDDLLLDAAKVFGQGHLSGAFLECYLIPGLDVRTDPTKEQCEAAMASPSINKMTEPNPHVWYLLETLEDLLPAKPAPAPEPAPGPALAGEQDWRGKVAQLERKLMEVTAASALQYMASASHSKVLAKSHSYYTLDPVRVRGRIPHCPRRKAAVAAALKELRTSARLARASIKALPALEAKEGPYQAIAEVLIGSLLANCSSGVGMAVKYKGTLQGVHRSGYMPDVSLWPANQAATWRNAQLLGEVETMAEFSDGQGRIIQYMSQALLEQQAAGESGASSRAAVEVCGFCTDLYSIVFYRAGVDSSTLEPRGWYTDRMPLLADDGAGADYDSPWTKKLTDGLGMLIDLLAAEPGQLAPLKARTAQSLTLRRYRLPSGGAGAAAASETVTLELNDVWGEGGQAAVYSSELDGEPCAVKVYHSDRVQRALRAEIRALISLAESDRVSSHARRHLPVLLARDNARAIAISPLGEYLQVKAVGGLKACGRALFDALCAVHSVGFVHLDVRPSNVVMYRKPAPSTSAAAGAGAGAGPASGSLDSPSLGPVEAASAVPVLIDFGLATPIGDDIGLCGFPLFAADELLDTEGRGGADGLRPATPAFDFESLAYTLAMLWVEMNGRKWRQLRSLTGEDVKRERRLIFHEDSFPVWLKKFLAALKAGVEDVSTLRAFLE